MIRYLMDHRMINPMSEDLFTKASELYGEFNETEYIEELNALLDNAYEGDVIQSEVLTIFEETSDKILQNFGIYSNDEMSLSQKVDMINALLLVEDIDNDLKDDMVNVLDAEDNIEALTNVLGEYFLIITEDLHYLLDHVDDIFIEILKDYLQQDDISDISLEEVYQKQLKKHSLETKYDITDVNKEYLNLVSMTDAGDYVVLNNFEKESLSLEQYAKRALIAVTFLSGEVNESIEKVIHLVPDEYEDQVRSFVLGETYA